MEYLKIAEIIAGVFVIGFLLWLMRSRPESEDSKDEDYPWSADNSEPEFSAPAILGHTNSPKSRHRHHLFDPGGGIRSKLLPTKPVHGDTEWDSYLQAFVVWDANSGEWVLESEWDDEVRQQPAPGKILRFTFTDGSVCDIDIGRGDGPGPEHDQECDCRSGGSCKNSGEACDCSHPSEEASSGSEKSLPNLSLGDGNQWVPSAQDTELVSKMFLSSTPSEPTCDCSHPTNDG